MHRNLKAAQALGMETIRELLERVVDILAALIQDMMLR